ncbi:MAG: apolipoprotein N-acyltransferase [Candidatus Omnitrophica bacterium]|nr:apolipoprotein N-acyltransferase [Candidatus Omnitrophota bacterium]
MPRQVNQLSIRKASFLSILSGILSALPYTNGNLWIFAWIGFVPLFFALRGRSRAQAFLLSFLAGIIFWSGTVWWLVHVTLAGTILLILYLSLYFGLFGLLTSPYLLPTTYCLLFLPSTWVLLEYLRSRILSGFPWALLGYSQYLNLPVIQAADITGAWGISFLIVLVNAAIYLALLRKQKSAVILSILCLLLSLGYGYYKIGYFSENTGSGTLKISAVQGNIAQDLKWEGAYRDFIMGRYIDLTLQAARDNPDLIIWPEASLPVVLEEEPFYYERVKNLTRQIGIPILLGAVTLRNGNYYNSAILVSAQGNSSGMYDKVHLVPFGEYIPLRKILGFLETIAPIGDITPGKEYKVFENPVKFSVLICFEDLFPELSRRFVREGAQVLVNITNDAWYKKSPAAYQHLAASVLRAVENRVSLVRSANTGVSCFIAQNGYITSYVKDKPGNTIFVSGYSTRDIYAGKKEPGFYTLHGDVFILLLFILEAYIIFRRRRI